MALGKTLFFASGEAQGPYTFTRSSDGREVGSDSLLNTISSDLLRIEYLDLDADGVPETPTLLLEAASTNALTRAEEFDDAAWTKTNSVIDADIGGAPDASTGLDMLFPSTANNVHLVSQGSLPVTESVDHGVSVFASAEGYDFVGLKINGTGTGDLAEALFKLDSSGSVVDSGIGGAGTLTATRIARIGPTLYRCSLIGQVSTSTAMDASFSVTETSSQMAASWEGGGTSGGLGIGIWGAQAEPDSPVTSYIPSSASTSSRAADTLFFVFPHVPQAMTVYISAVELGTLVDAASVNRLFAIGSDTDGVDPRLVIGANSGAWRLEHDNGSATASATAVASPTLGQQYELRAVLNANGSVLLGQSIESAAEATVEDATTVTLQSAWADTRAYLNSGGNTLQGVNAILEVKIVAGVKTMAEMRSLSPFFSVNGIDVPVRQNESVANVTEIGDRNRTFDGTMRETIRSQVHAWDADTPPLTLADRNTVVEQLQSSTQPQTAFGDMILLSTGEYPNVNTRVTRTRPIQSGRDRRYVVSFVAEESS